jgi:hypothetical protein
VAPCPDGVLGEAIEDEVEAIVVLPFTGVDTDLLLGASLVLLGLGAFLIRSATRRKEG